jgi:hypothetical protein
MSPRRSRVSSVRVACVLGAAAMVLSSGAVAARAAALRSDRGTRVCERPSPFRLFAATAGASPFVECGPGPSKRGPGLPILG